MSAAVRLEPTIDGFFASCAARKATIFTPSSSEVDTTATSSVRMQVQRTLDLAELDAVAAPLHHAILARRRCSRRDRPSGRVAGVAQRMPLRWMNALAFSAGRFQ
jgi:hypothetical protein